MTNLNRRGFLVGAAKTAAVVIATAATPAFAVGFQENEKGTNIVIKMKPGYENLARSFNSRSGSNTIAQTLINAERNRTQRGGSPDNNRPNSSKYERVLTGALKRITVGGKSLGSIARISTEEASAHHLCATSRDDGLIHIRFTSSGPGSDYKRNLSARVSVNGNDREYGNVNFAPSPRSGCSFTP